jgi:hypothetical protein
VLSPREAASAPPAPPAPLQPNRSIGGERR